MNDRGDDEGKGLWTGLCRQRGRLVPLMGSYVQSSTLVVRKPKPLLPVAPVVPVVQLLTSTSTDTATGCPVTTDRMRLPKVGAPGTDFLRRNGFCLPAEAQVLSTQKLMPKPKITNRTDYIRHLSLSVFEDRKRKIKYDYEPESPDDPNLGDPATSKEAIYMKRTNWIKQTELLNKIATRRQLEAGIMHSLLQGLQKCWQQNIANARPSENVIRKKVLKALDEDHRKMVSELRIGKPTSTESKLDMFDKWRTQLMDIVDQQGQKDLKMAKSARAFGRLKLPKITNRTKDMLDSRGSIKSCKTDIYDWI